MAIPAQATGKTVTNYTPSRAADTQVLESGRVIARHSHDQPYVTLVLSGGYVEAGDDGRFRAGPGHILVHGHYSSHADWVDAKGARTLNIGLDNILDGPFVLQAKDPDTVVRLAATDPDAAIHALFADAVALPRSIADWPDLLARDIQLDPGLSLGKWSRANDLAPATVSRGFSRAYGVSPARYRATLRARLAFNAVSGSSDDLAAIAHDFGFADQSHLTRSIFGLTGATPGHWRKVKNLQDRQTR